MEPIKQEIINNIFENGDKLITGPILQTVLIDMIDDVNVKDQEILSKTGSWDEAVTQIPNLATKEEVTNLSESVARDLENVDLTGYATEQWVESQGYLKEHQDLSDYATKVYVNEAKSTLESNLNNLSSSVSNDIQNKGEEVKTWVQNQGYLTEHQDISGLATKTELTTAENNLQGNITSLSESVARDIANVSVPEGVATEAWVQSQDYASKSYVDSAVSSSSVDLTGYATETWVQNQGYLKEHQDISGLATKSELTSVSESVQTDITNLATKGELNEAKNSLQGNITSLSESVARDLTGYATETWVESQGYLKEHQDISNLATKSELNSVSQSVQTDISNLATKTELNDTKNNLQGNITNLSESVARDLTGYATETWVESQGYLKEHQDISNLATKSELTSVSQSVQTDITNLSESVANSAVWKKGEGQDSLVKVLTGANEANTPTATGYAAIATGYSTRATGWNSHAEGQDTSANNYNSHAEGRGTIATNVAEHAEGTYNHNSENQIFSIGAGGDENGSLTRRNAVSVLVVPNSETQVNTASVFVQNVGGYDGTNPTPGTNDLATVISEVSSIWKKGEGGDSIVQKLSGDNEAKTSTATGYAAIAIGVATTASGPASHAGGEGTLASGWISHAEGYHTVASGDASHAGGEGTLASGRYGYTEGQFTTASGDWSHAEGASTKALQYCSHAEGEGTIASGHTSHAEGNSCQSPGQASHAEGGNTIASGWGSHAEGDHTTALEHCSHAEGNATTASAGTSHAEGSDTLTLGWCSHAEGNATTASAGTSHAEGSDTLTLGWCGHAEGQFTTASVHCSHAEGHRAEASGSWSHAEGNCTRTLEQCSHAEGNTTVTLGSYSHAEGNYTTASGDNSHAEGDNTTALGNCSHAEGDNTKASGSWSHAEGTHTMTLNDYEHAQGRYNYTSSNQIFSIGTGNSDTDRRNAVSVLEVSNNNSYTSSFFVQNIGGYDGTNPTPGTNDLATVISGLSSGGGSSETLWKKGTGTDSIVQILTGDNEAYTPTATGPGAIAIGLQTTASADYSHAEGLNTVAFGEASHAEGLYTNALGRCSHTEGDNTNASGDYSHAEGYQTVAPNSYECALGMCNHSSEGQIFSVGAGEGDPLNPFDPKPITRRNAISVLAVPNSDTQINTASVFVQNVGGYDGTNPIPGTNDLATVINGMSTGGGGESGNYLPLTGGTLTGDLRVNSSMGVGTGPQGTYCLAVGDSNTNTAGSHYALAVGENCQVAGAYGGVSLGRENVVNAAFGLATGFRCRTTYMAGYAGGCRSTASANFAFAAGFGAEATRVGQVVLGAYNELDPSGNNDSTGSYAVILANGKSSTWHQDRPGNITRSNGLAIKWDGGIDIKYQGSTVTLQDKLNEIEAKISSGGTATSTETWTFTLDDGSTVTKNILMA